MTPYVESPNFYFWSFKIIILKALTCEFYLDLFAEFSVGLCANNTFPDIFLSSLSNKS